MNINPTLGSSQGSINFMGIIFGGNKLLRD